MEFKLALALSLVDGMGPVSFHRLLGHFGSCQRIFSATEKELKSIPLKIKTPTLNRILQGPNLREVDRQFDHCVKYGASIVPWHAPQYPASLRESLVYPPPFIYMLGHWEAKDAQSIAIVGTRCPSAYGASHTVRMAADLGATHTIVSGLAKGVDTYAHQAALKVGARTIAVIGSGLDHIYPRENAGLFHLITKQGAVISEFPFGTRPQASHFPQRNRIISALSKGTLVIEAGEDSGALITARYALAQNKKIFALPGSIENINSSGTNLLIKEGAHLVCNAIDVLRHFNEPLTASSTSSQAIKVPVHIVYAPGPMHTTKFNTISIDSKIPNVPNANNASPSLAYKTKTLTLSSSHNLDSLNLGEKCLLSTLKKEPLPVDFIYHHTKLNTDWSAAPLSQMLSVLLRLELKGWVRKTPGPCYQLA